MNPFPPQPSIPAFLPPGSPRSPATPGVARSTRVGPVAVVEPVAQNPGPRSNSLAPGATPGGSRRGSRGTAALGPRQFGGLAPWLSLLLTLGLLGALPQPTHAWQAEPAETATQEAEPPGDRPAGDEPVGDEAPRDDLREPLSPRTGGAPAPVVPSLTDQIGSIPTRLSEMFFAGGFIMWPLALCSVVAFTFAVERMVVLRRRRVIPSDFVRRFLGQLEQQQLDRTAAIELCEANSSPIAQVFLHGVRKWGKPSVEVEQAILDGGERQVGHLRRHLRILNAVATIAPLLGLLGTVLGMIMCFNQIATSSAMGKSEQLAGGIGVALLTTAFGLAIAIPALMVYMYFAGRIDALVMEMDTLSQRVVDQISAEALAGQAALPPRGSPPRPKTLPPLGSTKSAP